MSNKQLNALRSMFLPLLLLITQYGYACQFDVDCGVGSKCVKRVGQLYGVCVGGLTPGNKYDDEPVYNPLDLNRGYKGYSDGDARRGRDDDGTYGDTCTFDIDCGIGRECVKSGLYGTCM